MFDTKVPNSGDSVKKMGYHLSRKPYIKISIMRKPEKKANNLFVMVLLILIITAGCATQHKYKKYKPIPCPCEKESKR
jgi:hypothetical protein